MILSSRTFSILAGMTASRVGCGEKRQPTDRLSPGLSSLQSERGSPARIELRATFRADAADEHFVERPSGSQAAGKQLPNGIWRERYQHVAGCAREMGGHGRLRPLRPVQFVTPKMIAQFVARQDLEAGERHEIAVDRRRVKSLWAQGTHDLRMCQRDSRLAKAFHHGSTGSGHPFAGASDELFKFRVRAVVR